VPPRAELTRRTGAHTGTLNYQGQQFEFCIRGLSIGDVGAARLAAEGAVFNLKSLDDFSGKYFALSGGFALARGESAGRRPAANLHDTPPGRIRINTDCRRVSAMA
jgi:hypothetical protein